jgi:vitamin K-dependent gamma-carboxylase
MTLLHRLRHSLGRPVDNTALVVFRILFGFLLFAESIGAILTGWVRENMVEVQFSFTFIGFECLNHLIGPGMYAYYAAMGAAGLMVMLGYRYRLGIWLFTILWTGTYLMQKTSYNNHYYLLIWICLVMALLPAHRYASLDVKSGRVQPTTHLVFWQYWLPVALMTIAYVYGSLAKIYPDWLDATFVRRAFTGRYETPWVAKLFDASWFHYFIAWNGVLFDLLVVPALLWSRTRLLATIASFVFHLFNSIVFQIGIFPYLSLGFLLFFYPPATIQRLFMRRKPLGPEPNTVTKPISSFTLAALSALIIIHLALPLRHHFIPGNVFWTEEGHRMSWRMMLRSKSGTANFYVRHQETGASMHFNPEDHLTDKQLRTIATHPDMLWQFAQYIRRHYEEQDIPISVQVQSWVSLNGRPYTLLIDPEVDLAAVRWSHFKAAPWITNGPFDEGWW